MKTKLTLLLVVLLPLAVRAADDLSTALQKGLFEEEANQNLPAAIKAYESLLAASDEQRKLAATALFRLGECYRKLGRTNDAVVQYQRLIRDFTDQATLTTLSRQNLHGLGVSPAMTASGNEPRTSQSMTSEARARLRELLQSEIGIAERFAVEQRKKVEAGVLASGEEVRFERDVLGLKRQLVAVDGVSSTEDRRNWRELLLQEIALAEKSVSLERRKLEVGKTTASEVARLQRDVLILKRELVAFETTPLSTSTVPVKPVTSVEAEELARTERILVQLSGWDLGQVRRLLPTVSPDADFEQYDRLLVEAQEKARTLTGEARDGWRKKEDEYTHLLELRFDQIRSRLTERAEQLRSKVAKQNAEALKQQTAAGMNGAVTPLNEEEQEIRRIQALIKDSPDLINAVNVEIAKVRSGELMVPKNGTLLHRAANQGQLGVARFLIEHGADVSVRDEMGRTPLHRAAGNGHKAMVELLLANKADVNAKIAQYPDNGATALHLAVEKGYRTVCETLLERGADPNAGDGSGAGPIYSAVGPGDDAILRLLLAKGANVNPEPGKKTYTPLHNASTTNIARILIEAGATVDALNQEKRSPLHLSAQAGNREVVEVLLNAGANPRLKDNGGITPLHLAAENWRASVVAPLIARGADPNERDASGRLPLDHLIRLDDNRSRDTSRTPQLETLEALLAGKADPNLTGASGIPHLYRAVDGGLEDLVETLLKAGADPNAKATLDSNRKDYTSLTRALWGGSKPRSISLVNLLLEHKADPNLADGNGNTPLYYAVGWHGLDFSEKAPFVEALLKRGANVEAWNIDGETPLIVAVNYPMKEMVALLLKNKADPNGKSRSGSTPLHFAAIKQHADIVELLLAAGADPNTLNAEGKSPLDYVKANSSTPQPGGFRLPLPPSLAPPPYIPGQPSSQRKETSPSELAERLRKAGARDWAPRPGLITVTRRSTGASQVIFSKGTNDWNRHSLLELIAFTYFGSGTQFPFPDFSRLMITRRDPASGAVKEFTVDLTAKLAADGCKADEWLEWGDLVEIPEGVHKLGEKWSALPAAEAENFEKCVARKVTLKAGAMSKELELKAGRNWSSLVNNGVLLRYQRQDPPRLRDVVLKSGLLLTSSDLSRTKVTRRDAAGARRDWTFDLTQSIPEEQDLWLRDGDLIEVPEK